VTAGDPSLWLLAVGAAAAGFVQGLSGFAFGMVATSIWVWGVEPHLTAVLVVLGGLTGQLLQALTMRRGLRMAALAPFLLGAAVGVPLGVAVLPHLDAALFKLTIGIVLVICCPAMLWAHGLSGFTFGGRLADAVTGAIGGVMGGLGGFPGVVPTLWCTLRGWDKDLQRQVVQNFNLAALASTFAIYVATGAVTRDMLPLAAVVVPAVIVPSLLGARVYVGLSPLAFRRVVLTLLTGAGIAMIIAGARGLANPA
jgi:uncharacterized membrane protein YfcA